MSTAFSHIPVLAEATLAALAPKPDGLYVDGTLGGGGHAGLVLEAGNPSSQLIGIDRDAAALAAAGENLARFGSRFTPLRGNYAEMDSLVAGLDIGQADGILLDIGVSSYQLDATERGFSYMQDAPLDMRMDQRQSRTAADLVNEESEAELNRILREYGEERWSARIAQFIVAARQCKRIENTGELVEIIKQAVPRGARDPDQHPAKRSFQALRIALNGELEALSQGLEAAVNLLKPGGRLAVITFHSLEDRLVKESFRLWSTDCLCPPHQPICTCGHRAIVRLYNRKPIVATAEEIAANPRSRSAKLRAVSKI